MLRLLYKHNDLLLICSKNFRSQAMAILICYDSGLRFAEQAEILFGTVYAFIITTMKKILHDGNGG